MWNWQQKIDYNYCFMIKYIETKERSKRLGLSVYKLKIQKKIIKFLVFYIASKMKIIFNSPPFHVLLNLHNLWNCGNFYSPWLEPQIPAVLQFTKIYMHEKLCWSFDLTNYNYKTSYKILNYIDFRKNNLIILKLSIIITLMHYHDDCKIVYNTIN